MTQPTYAAPTLPTATPVSRPGWLTATKVLVAGTLVAGGAGAAAIAGFVARIVYSGCFLTCSQGNPVAGALIGLLALALLVGGVVLAIVMWRRARTWHAVRIWAGIVLSVPVLYQLGGLGQVL